MCARCAGEPLANAANSSVIWLFMSVIPRHRAECFTPPARCAWRLPIVRAPCYCCSAMLVSTQPANPHFYFNVFVPLC